MKTGADMTISRQAAGNEPRWIQLPSFELLVLASMSIRSAFWLDAVGPSRACSARLQDDPARTSELCLSGEAGRPGPREER